MKSKISCFNVSSAVIREDFRKFWAVPLLAFIAYFLESIFFIIVEYSKASLNDSGELTRFVQNLLEGRNILIELNLVWVPILSALLIFSYLHNSGSVMSVHSQPFTRRTLINSHAISSFLFAVIPILTTGVILLIMSKPLYYTSDYYTSAKEMINVFSRTEVLLWIWESILTTTFVLVIGILAGMVTGTVLHHAIAALGFNAVLPVCAMLVDEYFNKYLFGYTTGEWYRRAIYYMSPVISGMESEHFSLFVNIMYIFAIILIYIFAFLLYRNRKLERVTDGIVFEAFDVVITYIFGFLGMSLLGMIFYSLFDENQFITVLGYVIGALLGIVICRMIIMKTIRIFSKKSVMIMGSYAVVAIVFFVGILGIGDICYNKVVPSPENVDSVYLEIESDHIDGIVNLSDGVKLKDKESVEAVIAYHNMLINNRSSINQRSSYYDSYELVQIVYMDKNGKAFESRSYNVPSSIVSFSEEEKTIVTLKELKEHQLGYLDPNNILSVDVSFPYYMSGADSSTTLTAKEANELIAAFKHDIEKRDFRAMYNGHTVAMANIGVNLIDSISEDENTRRSPEKYYDYYKNYANFAIYKTDKETIKWLNDNGYDKYLHVDSEWSKAVILPPGTYYSYADIEDNVDEIIKDSANRVIDDVEKIKNLYTESYKYDGNIPNESKEYSIIIFLIHEDGEYYPDAIAYLPDHIDDIQKEDAEA